MTEDAMTQPEQESVIQRIGEMAMLAYSDPHAPLEVYRAALGRIVNDAVAAAPTEPTISLRAAIEVVQKRSKAASQWIAYSTADLLIQELRAALPPPAPSHKHDFANYDVCKVCGLTPAAIDGCHHCNDSESVKNNRCWWCLAPAPPPTEPSEEAE